MSKIKVGILFGGRSVEHEVSIRSATSVYQQLDRSRFDPQAIYIDRKGIWHWTADLNPDDNAPEVVLLPRPHKITTADEQNIPQAMFAFVGTNRTKALDVIMPIVHGTNCEDGTLQGLLESAEVPFTGAGVLGSALCMDKEVTKRLAILAQIPVVPYRVAYSWDSRTQHQMLLADVEKHFGFPVFVKAAGQGSSLGVFKVKSKDQFLVQLQEAFQYDNKVLIEKAIAAREIEFSVLENPNRSDPPLVSRPAEIIPTHDFYTYEAKYLDDNGAVFKIPAEITETQRDQLAQLAQKTFSVLECDGYARIDLFLDRNTGEVFLNEVNTLPGFTSISMFPKLWEISGIAYPDLLTKLIDLAITRYQRRSKLIKERT